MRLWVIGLLVSAAFTIGTGEIPVIAKLDVVKKSISFLLNIFGSPFSSLTERTIFCRKKFHSHNQGY